MTDDSKSKPTIFHAGEIAIQARDGSAEKMETMGPMMVRPYMPDQHREFFSNLPFLVIGALDPDGQPWATAAFGPQGFLASPTPDTLTISHVPLLARELKLRLNVGEPVGLLGIELQTRRRNRMNGTIAALGATGLTVKVDQSYGNCPQYIQRRELAWRDNISSGRAFEANVADAAPRRLISSADTFYIASRSAELSAGTGGGVDVSHRGGKPGFVAINEDGSLSFPDFSGNRMYNTLGNIAVDHRVGLFFPNMETGEAVFLSGHARVDWDGPRIAAFDGAQRIIDVVPEQVIYVQGAVPIVGEFIDQSPKLADTGKWRKG